MKFARFTYRQRRRHAVRSMRRLLIELAPDGLTARAIASMPDVRVYRLTLQTCRRFVDALRDASVSAEQVAAAFRDFGDAFRDFDDAFRRFRIRW